MNPIAAGLPHRPPFLFLDEVTALEPGVSARGLKTFDPAEPFFAGHFPGAPIVPGVILTEALAQLAGIAVAESGSRFLLSAVRLMKFPRAAGPGERITLEASVRTRLGPLRQCVVRAAVAGETVAEGEIVLNEWPASP